ncbi:hypothetical protein LTS18_014542, partial [Coniosporium uncinatum]
MPKQSQTGNMKAKSTENIDTTFSPSDWSGKFEGSAGFFANSSPQSRKGSRASPITRGRTTNRPPSDPMTQGFMDGSRESPVNVDAVPPSQAQTTQTNGKMPPPPVPEKVRFSPEEWASKFKEPSFVYAPPKSTSPTRPGSASKATRLRTDSRAGKSTTIPRHASVDETIRETTNGIPVPDIRVPPSIQQDSPDAMDIDTESPKPQPNDTHTANVSPTDARSARNVPLQPHRADWQEPTTTTSAAPTTAANQPEMKTRLDDLANVAPFAPSKEGLTNLADLSTNLPFTSQP